MKASASLLLLVHSVLAATLAPLASAQASCFTSTYAILQAQLTSPQEEYIVCPNTTIQIGFPNVDFSNFENGDWPLIALGPNTKFLCGEDGSSSNNCVLDARFIHFLTLPALIPLGLSGITTENLYVSGFTFIGGKWSQLLLIVIYKHRMMN